MREEKLFNNFIFNELSKISQKLLNDLTKIANRHGIDLYELIIIFHLLGINSINILTRNSNTLTEPTFKKYKNLKKIIELTHKTISGDK